MMTICEAPEALEGVGLLLEGMSEEHQDPRYWALVAAVLLG